MSLKRSLHAQHFFRPVLLSLCFFFGRLLVRSLQFTSLRVGGGGYWYQAADDLLLSTPLPLGFPAQLAWALRLLNFQGTEAKLMSFDLAAELSPGPTLTGACGTPGGDVLE